MARPVGSRGSWFAVWQGESLPCVHKCWFKVSGKQPHYLDPGVTDDPKWAPFVQAIAEKKRVLLTDDELDALGSPVNRIGYIGLYRVDNVSFSSTELQFDFVERLESFV